MFYEKKNMLKKIKIWFLILKSKILVFPIVRRIFNEAKLYEGPLKSIEKGFKPFKWFQKDFKDETAEIMKIRTGFKNITIIKFDMKKLYDAEVAGDKTLLYLFGTLFQNFAISGGICAAKGYKFLWLDIKFVFVDTQLYNDFSEENRRFFLIHEIGHIVLGHIEYAPNCEIQNQILNFDFEYQADVFTRDLIKPRDPENAIKAFQGNRFCNELFHAMYDNNALIPYEKFKKMFDKGISFEINYRFKGEKLDPEEYSRVMVESAFAV